MHIQQQIDEYIASHTELKSSDLQELHRRVLEIMPGCKLWFLDGKNSDGKVVSNPNIGYGSRPHKYADGTIREFYQIGLSANKSGISVYILGIEDKKYLNETYGEDLGKATVTGYCIRFKTLKDINVELLEAAIRDGSSRQAKINITKEMEFDPRNNVIKLCVQGMGMEDKGEPEEAKRLFLQAWDDATNDFEKFTAAYYVARHQESAGDKLKWLETALQFALKINDVSVKAAFPALYTNIAKCYVELNNADNAKKNRDLADSSKGDPSDSGPFYHGTKADLQVGDLLTPGGNSNYQSDLVMNHIYFTAIANGAGLAAALANGDGHERVYIVEPTGPFEHDPNVTDKKFPGNPTRSYRSTASLKIVGEVSDWARQTPEQIKAWREKLANSKGEIIN